MGILGVCGIFANIIIVLIRGEAALGIFNQCFAFFIILSQIGVGGLQFSTLKHVSYQQNDHSAFKHILISALFLSGIISFLITVSLFTCNVYIEKIFKSPELAKGITLMLPGLFIYSLNKIILMGINGLGLMKQFAFFQALRPLLILISIIIISFQNTPDYYLILSLSFTEILVFFSMFIYFLCPKIYPLELDYNTIRDWLKRHISFGSRGFLSGVLVELNTRVDVLMLGILLSDKAVGIYSFASVIAEGIGQLSNIIRQNIDPIIGRAIAKKDSEQIKVCKILVRKKYFPKMLGIGLTLLVIYPSLLLLLNNYFNKNLDIKSYQVLIILIVFYVIASLYQPFIGLLIIVNKPELFTIIGVFAILFNVILNYFLIPIIGVHGAALSTGLIALLQALIVKKIGMQQLNKLL